MREIYAKYIEAKKIGWTEASVRSESIRLNKVMHLLDGDANKLWNEMVGRYGRHTRVTVFNRVSCFYDWAIKKGHIAGPNPYAIFREENPRLFQNFYVRKPSTLSFMDANRRVELIQDLQIRRKCLQLLTTGMRFTESNTLTPEGYVTGKGNKIRKVYPMASLAEVIAIDYRAGLRALKKVGINGFHMLRKIFLTECVRKGMNTFDLKTTAGWASLNTADSYIAANQQSIQEKISLIHAGAS